jgi:hypothetical protein
MSTTASMKTWTVRFMIRFITAHSFCSRRYMTDWWAKRSQLYKKRPLHQFKECLACSVATVTEHAKPYRHLEFARQLATLASSLSDLPEDCLITLEVSVSFSRASSCDPKTCRVSPADVSNRCKGWQQLDTGG